MTRTNKRTLRDLNEAPPSVGPKATHKGERNPNMNEQKAMKLIVQKNSFPGETMAPLPDIFVPLDGGVVASGAPTAPGVPGLNSAIPGPTTVDLSWSMPGDGGSAVTGFKVYRGTTPGGETLLTTLALTTTFHDTGLTNGTTYYYRVSALNVIGEGGLSNEMDATPAAAATAPGAPTLTAVTPGNTVADLTWTAPASNGGSAITAYKVYRGTSSGTETLLTTLGVVLNFHDTGLTNGTAYFYKVSAVNAIGEGAQSNELNGTPSAPSGMTLLDDFNRANIALMPPFEPNWNHPSVGTAAAIVSNRAQSPGPENTAIWVASTFGADQECGFDIGLVGTTTPHYYLLLNVAAVDPAPFTGYLIDYYQSGANYKIDVYRANAGTFTGVLATVSGLPVIVPGDFLSAHKVGGAITVKSNGGTQLSFTDPTPLTSAGYVGFGLRTVSSATPLAIDNFKGG